MRNSRAAVLTSFLVLGLGISGVIRASRSSLFLVKAVEVSIPKDQQEKAPLDSEFIAALATVQIGHSHLVDLPLAKVESKILSNDWIRSVALQKHFPDTLMIGVKFREPVALALSGHDL